MRRYLAVFSQWFWSSFILPFALFNIHNLRVKVQTKHAVFFGQILWSWKSDACHTPPRNHISSQILKIYTMHFFFFRHIWQGSAAFWFNLKPDGEGDDRTRHAGCPVLSGSKWGMRWFLHNSITNLWTWLVINYLLKHRLNFLFNLGNFEMMSTNPVWYLQPGSIYAAKLVIFTTNHCVLLGVFKNHK